MVVAAQSLYLMPRLDIPDLDGLIPTPRSQPAPIRTKGDAGHQVPVSGQSIDLTARGHVPELYGLVCTCRGEPMAIRTECNCVDGFLVTAQPAYFLYSRNIPNPDALVVVPGSQPTPIGAKGGIDH